MTFQSLKNFVKPLFFRYPLGRRVWAYLAKIYHSCPPPPNGLGYQKKLLSGKARAFYAGLDDQCGSPFSFAQHGQDVIVEQIFKTLGIEKPAYLDLGANRPVSCSNTALFYRRGARGIVVDAAAAHRPDWAKVRPEDVFVHALLTASPAATASFFIIDEKSGVNSADRQWLQSLYPDREPVEVTVPTLTISQIVARYANGVYPPFLSIDLEGWDLAILQSADFSASSPLVICVEADKNNRAAIVAELRRQNFVPYFLGVSDVIAIHQSVVSRLSSNETTTCNFGDKT